MTDILKSSQRAKRLLRWYPKIWRQRYGGEFIDLMEQEIAEKPRSFKRANNIIYRGLVARYRELGLAQSPLNSNDQPRASIATVVVVSTIFIALALNFWSISILNWNAQWRNPASVAITLWTGAVTIFGVIVIGLVVAIFCALLWSAMKRVVKGQPKGVIGPFSVTVSSTIFLVFSIRSTLRFVIARGGIDWLHPGQAIKQLAGTTHALTSTILWIWTNLPKSLTVGANIVYGLIPIALVALAFSVATIVRRTNFTIAATRWGRFVIMVLALAMALFVVAYFGLIASGNQILGSVFGQPLSYPPLVIEFAVMVLMAAFGLQAASRPMKNRGVLSADNT
jgi:hypothetical protein